LEIRSERGSIWSILNWYNLIRVNDRQIIVLVVNMLE